MTRRTLTCTLLAVAAATVPASAIAPAGETRQIATESTTPGLAKALSVGAPSVAWDSIERRFLVTWRYDGHIEEEPLTRGRFVDAAGVPQGPAFKVADGRGGALVHNPVTGGYGLIADGDLVTLDREGQVLARYRFAQGSGDSWLAALYGPPAIAVDRRTGAYLVAWLVNPQPDEWKILITLIRPGHGGVIETSPVLSPFGGPDLERSGSPALAWNPADGGFLLAWGSEEGLHVTRLDADGHRVGGITDVTATQPGNVVLTGVAGGRFTVGWSAPGPGPEGQSDAFTRRLRSDGSVDSEARRVTHVVSPAGLRGMVVGLSVADAGRDGDTLAVADIDAVGQEVYGQALGPDGAETGPDDVLLSGGPGTSDPGDKHGAVAADPSTGRYLVAWTSATRMEPLEFQVRVRVVRADAVTAPVSAAPVCRPLAAPPAVAGTGRVTRTVRQARITMRTARAALRRAEAAARWLDDGVVGRDICADGIGPVEFRTGTGAGAALTSLPNGAPDPRPVRIAAPEAEPRHLVLDAGRLAADQDTARRAMALVAALERRLDAGLTGGDVVDGSIDRTHLAPGFQPVGVPTGPADPPTPVARPVSVRVRGGVRVTLAQMRINQRIARAALLRADSLIRRLEDGIGPDEIRDGTLTAGDLASGLRAGAAPEG